MESSGVRVQPVFSLADEIFHWESAPTSLFLQAGDGVEMPRKWDDPFTWIRGSGRRRLTVSVTTICTLNSVGRFLSPGWHRIRIFIRTIRSQSVCSACVCEMSGPEVQRYWPHCVSQTVVHELLKPTTAWKLVLKQATPVPSLCYSVYE